MSALHDANLLAGQAVAYAQGYLDGRHDAPQLLANAEKLQLELILAGDASARVLLDPVRLLNLAMLRTAATALVLRTATRGDLNNRLADHATLIAGRLDRWKQITSSLVALVRHESRAAFGTASQADEACEASREAGGRAR